MEFPLAALLAALGLGALLLIDRVIYGDHHADHSPGSAQLQHSVYPYVLLALLSIHSIIAGITLGLESKRDRLVRYSARDPLPQGIRGIRTHGVHLRGGHPGEKTEIHARNLCDNDTNGRGHRPADGSGPG